MIKSNELRFGNYVIIKNYNSKYWNKIGKIEGFSRNAEYVSLDINKYSAFYLKDIEPIKLNEEILLKCGFKKHLDTIFIHWSKEGGMFEISTRLPYGSFGLWVNGTLGCFQYVHQLQNLYWCLVGEELNISL